MSDTILLGVLRMPPELWRDEDPMDKMQRYQRYLQASRRIEDQDREIEQLRAAMLTCASILERDGDEWGVGDVLRRAMAPNKEVRGASRPAGEASSREAATSTVVLCGADSEE